MEYCFYGCASLVQAPAIPSSITDMMGCFANCKNLKQAPTLPANVTNMSLCFYGCTSLTQAPDIPANVTNMSSCFYGCTNIQALKDFSKEQGNELNIGAVQKLLNMLCKYYWCAGWIQEPPHLPIDRDMLGTIKSATAWTHLDSIDEYKELIAAFKEKSKAEGFNSLAQWELTVWNAEETVPENF